MQALILAAGAGTRVGHREGRAPKCLLEVGGKTLIQHQIDVLHAAGVGSIVLVVGYEQQQIRDAIGDAARFVVNERYAETNSMYSFLLARDEIDDDVLVLNCDVVFDLIILDRLLQAEGNALTYDSLSGDEAEHMKIALWDEWLVEMSKNLVTEQSRGENLGMLRLSYAAAQRAFAAAAAIVAQGRERDWLASAINETARHHRFRCIDVAGLRWVEIDFASDLVRAQQEIWPAIQANAAARAVSEPAVAGAMARSLPTPDRRARTGAMRWFRSGSAAESSVAADPAASAA